MIKMLLCSLTSPEWHYHIVHYMTMNNEHPPYKAVIKYEGKPPFAASPQQYNA